MPPVVSVDIYDTPIQPVVDLDQDVVVYVPGYALQGPGEPTLVNSSNFTSIFGSTPYSFKANQISEEIQKNNIYRGRPDRGWLYAKGLVDAGLTVLYHRFKPDKVPVAASNTTVAESPKTGIKLVIIDDGTDNTKNSTYTCSNYLVNEKNIYIGAKSKFFGSYYADMKVEFSFATTLLGSFTVSVLKGSKTLESAVVSFNPNKNNFIGNQEFTYVDLFPYELEAEQPFIYDDFNSIGLDEHYSEDGGIHGLYPVLATVDNAASATSSLTLTAASSEADEFTVAEFMTALAKGDTTFKVLEDTERYPSITYITTGGYYQNDTIIPAISNVANTIKAVALIDVPVSDGEFTSASRSTLQKTLQNIASADRAKSTMFLGADTYVVNGYKMIMPESFGYLQALASNISQAIPPWIPVANNPRGVVSAVGTSHPITNAIRGDMITNDGISINPIIYKQNVGYTIMGNRTLVAVDGVAGPDAFLNCQLVVNTVARAARRAAQQLLIVSTNQQTAFNSFRSSVSKTCDKLLVNGDGLAAYSIVKQKKTLPATMDVVIELVVREGIERFRIYLPYSLELEA